MASRRVIHPQLGSGELLKTYMGGYEWEILFDSGRRFRLPAREFEADSVTAWQSRATPAGNGVTARAAVLEVDQFRARQTLEALRLGIVPVQDVETLTIGLEAERVSLDRALARSMERGGDALAVIGDYGFGKSHFVELAARRALRENCLAAVASLDLVEAPPSKANEIYKALIRGIRYPDSDQRGLAPLIRKALSTPSIVAQFIERSPRGQDDPIARALAALADCASQSAYDDIVNWLGGQIRTPTKASKSCLPKPPRLYLAGEVARQYAYMLTAISVLASMLGYGGLTLLIDESEHYSLLRANQRERADAFFKALSYAAALLQHRLRLRLPAAARALRSDRANRAGPALSRAQPAPDQPTRPRRCWRSWRGGCGCKDCRLRNARRSARSLRDISATGILYMRLFGYNRVHVMLYERTPTHEIKRSLGAPSCPFVDSLPFTNRVGALPAAGLFHSQHHNRRRHNEPETQGGR